MKIERFEARPAVFTLEPGDGSDAVHNAGQYGYAVCVLHTADGDGCEGHGLGFTLGGGTELVVRAIELLLEQDVKDQRLLIGRDIEAVMAEFGSILRRLSNHPALRWLGPEAGVVQIAMAAISNACWDLWAKARGLPLWQLLLELSPEALLAAVDLSYMEDALSREEALGLLRAAAATREQRMPVVERGYSGYDTSAGWFGYSDEQVVAKCRAAVETEKFAALKLKVGSPDYMDDVRRARLVRATVGPDVRIMLDCNQQWDLAKTLQAMDSLAEIKPFWIEEPTHVSDPLAHRKIRDVLAPKNIHVAVGEAIANRVAFKVYMQDEAVDVVQLDPTRQAGVSECLAIALLARKHKLLICPHAGCMGQISQHLVLFYHVGLDFEHLFLEHIPHLRPYFRYPATVSGGVYVTPREPGASTELLQFGN